MIARNDRSKWQRNELSNEALLAKAPSIFAERAMADVSAKYTFMPTIKFVDALRDQGWVPVHVQENRVRQEERRGFQKHMIRFHQADPKPLTRLGDVKLELSMVNSHDRSSGYQFHAGVFRLVCLNGMMVSDSVLGRISVPHIGISINEVVNAVGQITGAAPQIGQNIEAMRTRILSEAERKAFAESAIILRYDQAEESPIPAADLLATTRREDQGRDLWHTFNTVQENLLRGGQQGYVVKDGKSKRVRSRAVQAITEDVRLNKALWHLAEVLRQDGDPTKAVN